MKTFQELSKRELSVLTEEQIDAYIDIELANKQIVKPLNLQVDYPNFVKSNGSLPEKDMTTYEVDWYYFLDLDTAQKFATFVGTLEQAQINYDYFSSESQYYVTWTQVNNPQIQIKKMYSLAKYEACKEQIKHYIENKKAQEKKNESEVYSVINYAAIDEVKYALRNSVRDAIRFFAEANKIASDYPKYLGVTGDKEQAITVLFTVYNVQDGELKTEVESLISNNTEINN